MVTVQEEQPPVAHRHAFAERDAHRFRVGEGLVPGFQPFDFRAVELFLRDRLLGHRFDRRQQFVARRVHILLRPELRAEQRKAGLSQPLCERIGGGSQTLFGQPLVQTPAGRVAHDGAQQIDRGEVRVCSGRHVVGRIEHRHAAGAAQGDAAFTVLHRVQRVLHRQHAGRLLDHAEGLRDPRQRLRRRELARHDQRRVVRLVIQVIEGLQTRDVDVLDVAASADRVLAVVVPLVHRRQRLREQDAVGAVLARFHLIAHHRHLGVQRLACDVAVDHRIGLPAQVPAKVVVVGREAGGVIGAVEPGAAVGRQTALGEVGPDVGVLGRALEHQVLQQVGHAGLAVVFLA